MYQLLIVDDEEDIRRGMARGIPWIFSKRF